jgi:hypothetical protein
MLPDLLLESPLSVVAALLAVALVQVYILYREAFRLFLLELSTTDWWNLAAGFVMPHASLTRDGVCEACEAPAHLRCSRCKEARYCSAECQRRHWKAGHKTECGTPRVQSTKEELAARHASLDAKVQCLPKSLFLSSSFF